MICKEKKNLSISFFKIPKSEKDSCFYIKHGNQKAHDMI